MQNFNFELLKENEKEQYCEKCLSVKYPDLQFEIFLADTELCDECNRINEVANPSLLIWAKENKIDPKEYHQSGNQMVFRPVEDIITRKHKKNS